MLLHICLVVEEDEEDAVWLGALIIDGDLQVLVSRNLGNPCMLHIVLAIKSTLTCVALVGIPQSESWH